MNIYSQTIQDMTANANAVKNAVENAMVSEGFLTPENAKKFAENYAVVVYERGFLGSILSKILDGDNTKLIIRVVRIV